MFSPVLGSKSRPSRSGSTKPATPLTSSSKLLKVADQVERYRDFENSNDDFSNSASNTDAIFSDGSLETVNRNKYITELWKANSARKPPMRESMKIKSENLLGKLKAAVASEEKKTPRASTRILRHSNRIPTSVAEKANAPAPYMTSLSSSFVQKHHYHQQQQLQREQQQQEQLQKTQQTQQTTQQTQKSEHKSHTLVPIPRISLPQSSHTLHTPQTTPHTPKSQQSLQISSNMSSPTVAKNRSSFKLKLERSMPSTPKSGSRPSQRTSINSSMRNKSNSFQFPAIFLGHDSKDAFESTSQPFSTIFHSHKAHTSSEKSHKLDLHMSKSALERKSGNKEQLQLFPTASEPMDKFLPTAKRKSSTTSEARISGAHDSNSAFLGSGSTNNSPGMSQSSSFRILRPSTSNAKDLNAKFRVSAKIGGRVKSRSSISLKRNAHFTTKPEDFDCFDFPQDDFPGINVEDEELLADALVQSSKSRNLALFSSSRRMIKSSFPSLNAMDAVCAELPRHLRGRELDLVYSTNTDRLDMNVFYKKISKKRETIILVTDKMGWKFGCFASMPWIDSAGFYGDYRSFLFTLEPVFKIYRSNQELATCQIQKCNGSLIAMGGGKNFALLIPSLMKGKSAPSETFNNPCLAGSEDFSISCLEVFGIV